jgi:hypothetical protein
VTNTLSCLEGEAITKGNMRIVALGIAERRRVVCKEGLWTATFGLGGTKLREREDGRQQDPEERVGSPTSMIRPSLQINRCGSQRGMA